MHVWTNRSAILAVVVVCFALLSARPRTARAVDVEVEEISARDGIYTARLRSSTEVLEAAIRAGVDAELRRAVPALYQTYDLGLLRYRDTQTSVSSLVLSPRPDPHEVQIAMVIELHARRDRRDLLTGRIRDEGPERVASIATVLVARAEVVDGSIVVTVRHERSEPTIQLQALRGTRVPIAVSRELGRRTVEIATLAEYGVMPSDVRLVALDGHAATFDVDVVPQVAPEAEERGE
ncbi:hypothetical protein [Sandaracinus amylolyticus]|uniref:hypothetical protein n=1 Tax=Sandaracinus amylolyticus TaxID=927083 RepID=UPI001F169C0D|nr:hypothetical protein [Sandaracinus amylolyticus]UJR84188.1 Hypothetical protein I5071_62590 [Sandaracinus amylolyticus]